MFRTLCQTFLSLTLASTLLAGCGALPGVSAGIQTQTVAGKAVVKLGFGAEGGTAPALCPLADGGWLVVYVGTNVGDRHLYWATSQDGTRWSAPRAIEAAAHSEQAPCLVADAQGVPHLFFASNRNGENFELFQARFEAGAFSAPQAIEGFTGIQNLAVAYRDGRFLLAAEVMAEGLFAATSADGEHFGERELLANAGFDPAATFLPDGRALVAYTRGNEILTRASAPGADWGPEASAAQTDTRMREPALIWAGDHGKLIYCERQANNSYQLRERRFDGRLSFSNGQALPDLGGDSHTPAVASDHNGITGLAWGMKLISGQQGVVFTLDGWK